VLSGGGSCLRSPNLTFPIAAPPKKQSNFDRLANQNSGFTGMLAPPAEGGGSAPAPPAGPPAPAVSCGGVKGLGPLSAVSVGCSIPSPPRFAPPNQPNPTQPKPTPTIPKQGCSVGGGAKIVVHSVRPVPGPDQAPCITLRNIGAQAANLTGNLLMASSSSDALTVAQGRECAANASLPAGGLMTFTPRTESNPCGFPFTLNATGTARLADKDNNTIAQVAWAEFPAGARLLRKDDGGYTTVAPGRNVLQLLEDLGQFQVLLAALKVQLAAASLGGLSCAQGCSPVFLHSITITLLQPTPPPSYTTPGHRHGRPALRRQRPRLHRSPAGGRRPPGLSRVPLVVRLPGAALPIAVPLSRRQQGGSCAGRRPRRRALHGEAGVRLACFAVGLCPCLSYTW
jgi:hypothetical protein